MEESGTTKALRSTEEWSCVFNPLVLTENDTHKQVQRQKKTYPSSESPSAAPDKSLRAAEEAQKGLIKQFRENKHTQIKV